MNIWFWEKAPSPHKVPLMKALARLGHRVTVISQETLLRERVSAGWQPPNTDGLTCVLASTPAEVLALVVSAPSDVVHICQGLRGTRLSSIIQDTLKYHRCRYYVMMETVDDAGLVGVARRLEYMRLLRSRCLNIIGFLAIGHSTADWLVARGAPATGTFSFAYFLDDSFRKAPPYERKPGPFRFMFVGELINRKRVDWIIEALDPRHPLPFELIIVGSGAQGLALRELAGRKLPGRVKWLGTLPMHNAVEAISNADCLLLPSRHDGWGAVASESLIVGTPVVCSDSCGAAGVVQASGFGRRFTTNDRRAFRNCLAQQLEVGPITPHDRRSLQAWSVCLCAEAGARYLSEILSSSSGGSLTRPTPPWVALETGRYPIEPVSD